MSTDQNGTVIKAPIVKCSTAIAAASGANSGVAGEVKQDLIAQVIMGTTPDWLLPILSLPWGHIASMAAALYTTALMAEWLWKKPIRWMLIKIGVRKPQTRFTYEEWATKVKDEQ